MNLPQELQESPDTPETLSDSYTSLAQTLQHTSTTFHPDQWKRTYAQSQHILAKKTPRKKTALRQTQHRPPQLPSFLNQYLERPDIVQQVLAPYTTPDFDHQSNHAKETTTEQDQFSDSFVALPALSVPSLQPVLSNTEKDVQILYKELKKATVVRKTSDQYQDRILRRKGKRTGIRLPKVRKSKRSQATPSVIESESDDEGENGGDLSRGINQLSDTSAPPEGPISEHSIEQTSSQLTSTDELTQPSLQQMSVESSLVSDRSTEQIASEVISRSGHQQMSVESSIVSDCCAEQIASEVAPQPSLQQASIESISTSGTTKDSTASIPLSSEQYSPTIMQVQKSIVKQNLPAPVPSTAIDHFKTELVQSKAQHEKARTTVGKTIEEVKRFLPLELIYAHGKGKFASAEEQRAMLTVEKAIARITRGQYLLGFEKWKAFTVAKREAERLYCAVRIQCSWRVFVSNKEVAYRKREYQAQKQREALILRLLSTKENKAASAITKAIQSYVIRLKEAREQQRLAAACCIQKFFRSLKEQWQSAIVMATRIKQYHASIRIQAQIRCFLSRRKLRLLKKIDRVEKAALRREQEREEKRMAFRYEGAVLRIQQSWKRKLEVRRLKYVRIRMLNERKEKHASIIQAFFRSELSKKRTRIRRVKYPRAVVKLQCFWRCVVARRVYNQLVQARLSHIAARRERKEQVRKQEESKTTDAAPRNQLKLGFGNGISQYRKSVNAALSKPEKSSLKLQAWWRGTRARRRMKKLRKVRAREQNRQSWQRKKRAAITIQRHARGIRGRRRYWLVKQSLNALKIQNLYKGYKTRQEVALLQVKIRLVKLIEERWLTSKSMKKFRKEQMAATRMQSVVRGYFARARAVKMVERAHRLEEINEVGRRRLASTLSRVADELLVFNMEADLSTSRDVKRQLYAPSKDMSDASAIAEGGEKGNPPSQKRIPCGGVWQELYESICSWGTRGGASVQLDGVRFARFFNESPKLLTPEASIQNLDILFSKARGLHGRTIEYGQFMNIVNQFLDMRFFPSRKKSGKKKAAVDKKVILIPDSPYLVTEQAFLLMMKDHVLKANWGKAFRKKLNQHARDRVEWAVTQIQTSMRGCLGRKSFVEQMAENLRNLQQKYLSDMATRIQSRWRIRCCQRQIQQLLAQLIIEYIDADTGVPFYVNSRTGETKWTKPVLLGELPCTVSIPLPLPGEEYVAYCKEHADESPDGKTTILATVYCIECEVALCPTCFVRLHDSRPAMQKHTSINIECCRVCKMQTATRKCNQCGDGEWQFCDTCYPHLHASGTLKSHTFEEIVCMCSECGVKAAQWKCEICKDIYCKKCFADFHRKGRRQKHPMVHIPYYSVHARRAEAEREVKRQEQEKRMKFQLEQQLELERLQEIAFNEAVVKIQCRFRARKARIEAREYMKLVRQTQQAIHQRQQDDIERSKVGYKVMNVFGRSKELKSDTLLEKQQRLEKKSFVSAMSALAGIETESSRLFKGDSNQIRTSVTDLGAAEASVAEVPSWCEFGKDVVVTKGEYKNCVASVLSTKTVAETGNVSVFLTEATLTVTMPLLHLRPKYSDEEEKLRASKLLQVQSGIVSGLSATTSKIGKAKHMMSMKVADAVEQKQLNSKISYLETVEFKDIVPFAWKELAIEATPTRVAPQPIGNVGEVYWWNVVNNRLSRSMPPGIKNLSRLDYDARNDILERMKLAEAKLTKILSSSSRVEKGAVGRRHALDGSFQEKRDVGLANKFYNKVSSEQFGSGEAVEGLSGAYQLMIAKFLEKYDDEEDDMCAELIQVLRKGTLNEKLETLDEMKLDKYKSSLKATKAYIKGLYQMSPEARIIRREEIEQRRNPQANQS